jgi:hypothetical protein
VENLAPFCDFQPASKVPLVPRLVGSSPSFCLVATARNTGEVIINSPTTLIFFALRLRNCWYLLGISQLRFPFQIRAARRDCQHLPPAISTMSLHMPEDAASVLEQFMHDGKFSPSFNVSVLPY